MVHGVFIAIEGVDGSGKKTQTKLLCDRFQSIGKDVYTISFPRYGELSAKIIEKYLRGELGDSRSQPPELMSLAYAVDRFGAAETIRRKINHGFVVIADRYAASNLAHQGTKIRDEAQRKAFYNETLQLEYETLGIPKPSLNIVLLVPSAVAQPNVDQKDARTYTTKQRDIHEADANHLELAKKNYEELCDLYPDEFVAVECMHDESTMRSIEDIHQDIWQQVKPLL